MTTALRVLDEVSENPFLLLSRVLFYPFEKRSGIFSPNNSVVDNVSMVVDRISENFTTFACQTMDHLICMQLRTIVVVVVIECVRMT